MGASVGVRVAMPQIPLGFTPNNRASTWTPKLRIVNMVAEPSETNPFTGVNHVQRPGLEGFTDFGPGFVRGVYRQAGTFDGDFLVATNGAWYRVKDLTGVPTKLADIPGNQRVTMAATRDRAIMVSDDGFAFSTDGTTVVPVIMPDDRLVGSISQLNGYFYLSELDSARFYWIEPGQANPDGLSFATTESTPGYIQKTERVGDEIWFLKEEGTEVWTATGDSDLPLQRSPGRNYDKGCRNGQSVTRFDNSLAWVGNDGIVYRADNSPVRISDNSIEEQIRSSTVESLRAWSYAVDGHTMYVLTMTTGTFAYDASTQQWSQFNTYGRTTWRCHVGDMGRDFMVAGDDTLGFLYRLDPNTSNDYWTPMERVVSGGVGSTGADQQCDSLDLYVTTGTATDPNLYPKVRIRWTDDLQNYNDWRDESIGRTGEYGKRVRITRLGRIRYPGRIWEFGVTDDVVATISAAAYNEPLI